MSQALQLTIWEVEQLTPEQADRLLSSGLYWYKLERRYLEMRAKQVPFNRLRLPRYLADDMVVIKARMLKRQGGVV
jgi:hypothetical protein